MVSMFLFRPIVSNAPPLAHLVTLFTSLALSKESPFAIGIAKTHLVHKHFQIKRSGTVEMSKRKHHMFTN